MAVTKYVDRWLISPKPPKTQWVGLCAGCDFRASASDHNLVLDALANHKCATN